MGRVSDARERLLKAALELLWEQGYGGIRVDSVCERAGVQKGTFYHFFQSKSDLTVEALRHHWETIAPEYDRVFSARFTPAERLSRYFAWVYERQKGHRARAGRVLGCPMLSVGCEVIEQDSAISAAVRELLRKRAAYFEALFREVKGGGAAPFTDPAAQAQGLLAYVVGVVTQARIQDDLSVLKTLEAGAQRFLAPEPPPLRRPAVRALTGRSRK